MKQLLLLMACVGLATTGCAQNRVLGTHARRGGASMNIARSQATQPRDIRSLDQQDSGDIQLATYGAAGRCRTGCSDGGCSDGSCCSDGLCEVGGCSSAGCSDGKCSDGRKGLFGNGKGLFSGRDKKDGCSSCNGNGCGLCQRVAGRFRGMNPHSGGYPAGQNFNASQPGGQVAYPYYTTRGPRDFLNPNPPSIGPY